MENLKTELSRLSKLYTAVSELYSEGLYTDSEKRYWEKLIADKMQSIRFRIKRLHQESL